VVTGSILQPDMTPAAIDRAVTEAVQTGEGNTALYATNLQLLRELQPDIILTQTICDVCAVNAGAVSTGLPPGTQMVNLAATSIDGLWNDLRNVAGATGASAAKPINDLQARLDAVEHAVAGREQKRVLALEWLDPPFLGGHWVPEIVERAGGIHILGRSDEPSRRASWDEIFEADPEVLLLTPCGYNLEDTASQGDEFVAKYGRIPAVRNNAVWATDATRFFSRCTPATIRAVEIVAGILHPEVCAPPLAGEARRLAVHV
ncbi:MAG TPA: ABC transporter substrate-binding protein, partial [Abditibacteriaceae bacterium]